jgi:beta-lactamase regulating signal transducer with metallopeptidase domain
MIDPLLQSLWQSSWQATIVAMLVLLLRATFGRLMTARWRHALWVLVLFRLVIPVFPECRLSLFSLLAEFAPHAQSSQPSVLAKILGSGTTVTISYGAAEKPVSPQLRKVSPTAQPFWNQSRLIAAVWLLGTLSVLLRLAVSQIRFLSRLGENSLDTPPHVPAILNQCLLELHMDRPPIVLVTQAVDSPAVVGLFSPRLLLPRAPIDSSQLRLIFLHELAHIKCRDVAMDWLWAILQALHWFNPVLWWIAPLRRADREQARDELVLKIAGTQYASDYGQTLLNLAAGSAIQSIVPGLIGLGSANNRLRERIQNLASIDDRRSLGGFIGAALVLAGGCSTLTNPPTASPPLITSAVTPVKTQFATPAAIPHQQLETCRYDIRDLLFIPPDYDGTATITPADSQQTVKQLGKRLEDIKTYIRANVAVSDQSPMGTIESDPANMCLIITDTQPHQAEIQNALNSLRTSRGDQISVETRFLIVKEDEIRGLPRPVQYHFAALSGAGENRTDQILTGPEASEIIRSCHSPSDTTLTAPRLTFFEGQRCVVHVETKRAYVSDLTAVSAPGVGLYDPTVSTLNELDLQLHCSARHSPDKQTVSLDLQAQLSRLLALLPVTIHWPDPKLPVTGTYQVPVLVHYDRHLFCIVPDKKTLLLRIMPTFAPTEESATTQPAVTEGISRAIDQESKKNLYLLIKPAIIPR